MVQFIENMTRYILITLTLLSLISLSSCASVHQPVIETVRLYFASVFSLFKGLIDTSYNQNYYRCMIMHDKMQDRCAVADTTCLIGCINHIETLDTTECTYGSNMRWYANFFSLYNSVLYKLREECQLVFPNQTLHNMFDKKKCLEDYINYDDIDTSCIDWIQHFGCGGSECPCRKTMYITSNDVFKLAPCKIEIFATKTDINSLVTLVILFLFWSIQVVSMLKNNMHK